MGTSLVSSGWDSVIPLQGGQVRSLVWDLGSPACPNGQPRKKKQSWVFVSSSKTQGKTWERYQWFTFTSLIRNHKKWDPIGLHVTHLVSSSYETKHVN